MNYEEFLKFVTIKNKYYLCILTYNDRWVWVVVIDTVRHFKC